MSGLEKLMCRFEYEAGVKRTTYQADHGIHVPSKVKDRLPKEFHPLGLEELTAKDLTSM
ncbi:MAG TPA: hypothetical protein VG146_20420 [Verrucomicrobiae bacterium]|nr:hypothetical protein [Verrucomicrobiae bacterium]